MARKKQTGKPPSRVLTENDLTMAIRKLERRIGDLTSFDVNTINERFDSKGEALKKKINSTLADIFGRDTPEYNDYSIWSLDTLPLISGGPGHSVNVVRDAYQIGINDTITKLTSLKEILEEKLEDHESSLVETKPERVQPKNKQVFIVHGHDKLAKQIVARFISQLELEPIILHEQPNGGKTIIEKIEAHTLVDFSVVLLTPDDIGYSTGNPDKQRHRARQNVILELGFFLGALGRERVCALYKGDIEIPSDYDGVLFVKMDDAGAWKLTLARELKQAEVEIDMNNAI